MNTTIAISRGNTKAKALFTAIAIIAAVALPQVFHAIGVLSGTGTQVGATFLPMHIPVILAGFLAGPVVGALVGALSPLLSYLISGMPTAALLPFMAIELLGYGLVSGLLAERKMPVIVKVFAVMVAGRALKAVAVLFTVYVLGGDSAAIVAIWTSIVTGLPGIVLQLALIPLLIYRINVKKSNEA